MVTTKGLFQVIMGMSVLGMYAMMVLAFRLGNPWIAVGACWLASPITMFVLAALVERRSLAEVINLRHGSLAFLLGDTIFLPAMAAAIALGWRKVNQTGWTVSVWWVTAALVFGLAAGLWFHHNDARVYTELALNSPTKLWHDFVAYPVLFGGLLFGFVPMIGQSSWRLIALAVVFVIFWLVAGISDGTWHKLDPKNLHIDYHWSGEPTG